MLDRDELDEEEIANIVHRRPTIRRATKIEYSLLVGLVMQAAALIWGAAKLTAGVDNLTKNMNAMSDYSVLRFQVQQSERKIEILEAKVENLSPRR